jgi:hypothetical protein
MKTKLLRQKTAPIIGENINKIDKLTCEQLLNFMLKAENCNHLNTNNMLVPVKNRNKKSSQHLCCYHQDQVKRYHVLQEDDWATRNLPPKCGV